jgi:glycine/D-amino acid oxidase-like deaminating enzyme
LSTPVQSVVIVGGGTAGWITAARIAARHRSHEGGVRVTLIESPNVATIGVGEGTWPTMRSTLRKIGISETQFIRECEATFKQGAKFARWVTGDADDYYYHPLVLPQGFNKVNLPAYWQELCENVSFSAAVCFQEAVCEHGLAPKLITTPEYGAVANYAYHLNAAKFAEFLRVHCTTKLGVRHVLDDVTTIHAAPNGDIASVSTARHGSISGDLFVDCTGFAALLLGKHFGVPFIDRGDVLFIDNAIAVQVPYESTEAPVACQTISTAQAAGWIWDIGLHTRRGVGYVYSSRHTDHDTALQTLRDYVGPAIDGLHVRRIPIRSGHRQRFWQNNCAAVGLSAGFLEPLEASALVLIELSAEMISEQLPACREVMDIVARRFNQTFTYRWDRIIDFLKLHYMLSQRTDAPFWHDNRDPATIPESLQEQLALWRYAPPGNHDFTSNNEVFPAASYQYVLYGMRFRTDTRFIAHTLSEHEEAREQFRQNDRAVRQALTTLPKHRELLRKVQQYGFQAI